MSKNRRKARAKAEPIEGPAKIAEDHVQNRAYVIELGETPARAKPAVAPGKAWRRLSPLEQAFLRGQLAGGSARHDAEARLQAGKRYGGMFAVAQSTGRDCTNLDKITGSGAGSHSISDSQAEAIRRLILVEMKLGARDRAIVRMVCGQGFFPSEAVRQVCADYKHTIPARLREALDALVEAFEAVRRERLSAMKKTDP